MESIDRLGAGGSALGCRLRSPVPEWWPAAGGRLRGGNDGGAVLVGRTVWRPVRPWTESVHALLRHLEAKGFDGAPRVLGIGSDGHEILTYLEGETVGDSAVWPAWTRSEAALGQVARWLRGYHEAVADFAPPAGARWRLGGRRAPRAIIGHNDAGPFNAAWRAGRLTGFFDWDFAGPTTVDSDVAWTALAWVPLYARRVAAAEGFRDFAARPARLRLFLDAYGWNGNPAALIKEAQERMSVRARQIRRFGVTGTGLYARLLRRGVADDLDEAIRELVDFRC